MKQGTIIQSLVIVKKRHEATPEPISLHLKFRSDL